MKSIIFLCKTQFGYHIDSYKYCQYLSKKFNITYICFDQEREKVTLDGIDVVYVNFKQSKIIRILALIKATLVNIKSKKDCIVFVNYFLGCSLLSAGRYFVNRKIFFHCDIRTLQVNTGLIHTFFSNLILNIELLFFSSKSIISEGVKSKLYFVRNAYVLPLGGEALSKSVNLAENSSLCYIGTLNGRCLIETLKGFNKLIKEENYNKLTYDIIGSGNEIEESKLSNYIKKYKLSDKVKMHGYLSHENASEIVKRSSIGICYYPITESYQNQPPTKLFEYVLSGLPCVSVKTRETEKYINDSNGVLIMDNADSFYAGIKKVLANECWDSEQIKASLEDFTWQNIVDSNLLPIINTIFSQRTNEL